MWQIYGGIVNAEGKRKIFFRVIKEFCFAIMYTDDYYFSDLLAGKSYGKATDYCFGNEKLSVMYGAIRSSLCGDVG